MATQDSPNANEPSHLAAGVSHWEFGRFELYRVNPPLVRMVAAIPAVWLGCETDWSAFTDSPGARPEFTIGPDFIAANGERAFELTTYGRWACLPFSVLGAWVCWRWAREMYGEFAGLLACGLWCFSPNVLAHAGYFCPDLGSTAVGVAAWYVYWTWLRRPTWGWSALAGVVLGFALLTKSTWVLLFVLFPVAWGAWRLMKPSGEAPRPLLSSMAQMAMILLLGLHVLNLGYLYDGFFRRLGDYEFVSESLSGVDSGTGNRFSDTWLAKVPVPLPVQYVLGIDTQKADFESKDGSYYRGEWHVRGVWYYYLFAMAIKVPLGTWLLAGLAIASRFIVDRPDVSRRDEIVLWLPFLFYLIFVSAETDYNAHLRYVLLTFPYAFIGISRAAAMIELGRPRLSACIAAAMAWSLASMLWVYPHPLSYFNELVGGPAYGHAHLTNSNIDWGQDLFYLRDWLDDHPEARPLTLAYYGMFNPVHAGIKFSTTPRFKSDLDTSPKIGSDEPLEGPQPGWHAVSVNFLRGHEFWDWKGDGTRNWHGERYFTWFQYLEPIGRAGWSINIYHVTPEDANRVRQKLGLSPIGKRQFEPADGDTISNRDP